VVAVIFTMRTILVARVTGTGVGSGSYMKSITVALMRCQSL